MCGIFGVVTALGSSPSLDRAGVERLRDRLAHRGPDDAGYWESAEGHVRFGHRRLAVIDPTPAGHQPWVLRASRSSFAGARSANDARRPDAGGIAGVLVYNGEIYNDAALRDALLSRPDVAGPNAAPAPPPRPFQTRSDAETLARTLERWGVEALPRLRAMYAFAWYDPARATLLLARDSLGIKPLYWTRVSRPDADEIAFSSEIAPLLEHPRISPTPDLATVSAYLTTIRTTLAERTLFQGIRTLEPGQWIEFDLSKRALPERRGMVRVIDAAPIGIETRDADDADALRAVIVESTHAHLRSDVPTCALLSGGLDSTILATIAAKAAPGLRTYCSGAPAASTDEPSDIEFAREVAAALASRHTEAPVTREMFLERWRDLVAVARVPLSTPNEVAIHEVARVLRRQGCVVALSGEGADELFAGYEAPLESAARAVAAGDDLPLAHLRDSAWTPLESKPAILGERAWRAAEHDAPLIAAYRAEHVRARDERDDDPMQAHLRLVRRVNLAGLLLRLDAATMREGVEGRTPFADAAVARCTESLPMGRKFERSLPGTPARTKIALREAFAQDLSPRVLHRPKASFPLPFAEWIAGEARASLSSPFAREIFTPAAIEHVSAQPRDLWRLAWPMMNLAAWGRQFA